MRLRAEIYDAYRAPGGNYEDGSWYAEMLVAPIDEVPPLGTACVLDIDITPPAWSHDPPTEPGWYWRRQRYPDPVSGHTCWFPPRPDIVTPLHIEAGPTYNVQWWPIRIQEPGKEGGE